MDDVRLKLEELDRKLDALSERVAPARLTVPKKEAARLLSRSLSTIKGMIRRGELVPTKVAGQTMISWAELLRVATPQERAQMLGTPTKRERPQKVDPEAAKIRAALKKKRKR